MYIARIMNNGGVKLKGKMKQDQAAAAARVFPYGQSHPLLTSCASELVRDSRCSRSKSTENFPAPNWLSEVGVKSGIEIAKRGPGPLLSNGDLITVGSTSG